MSKVLIIIVSFLCCFEGLQSEGPESTDRTKLLIDHDGGADDAMAIFMALLYEKYFNGPQVVGLTCTFGNVNETQTFLNSQRILDKAGRRDIPIYRGASRSLIKSVETDYYFGVDGLGENKNDEFQAISAQKEHAVFALIELSKKYKGELVVLLMGSTTNFALAKIIDPEITGRLKQIYVGAGTIDSADKPYIGFNSEMDAEAYRIMLEKENPSKLTIIPTIRTDFNVSREWRVDILGKIPTKIMEAQNSYERISLASGDKWSLADPILAAIALDNSVVQQFKYSNSEIILCGHERGLNYNNFSSDDPNVRMAYSLKISSYKKFLVDIFSAELQNELL